MKEEYKRRCETCNHEVCPYCNIGCHNPDCPDTVKPSKVCYDGLLKPLKN